MPISEAKALVGRPPRIHHLLYGIPRFSCVSILSLKFHLAPVNSDSSGTLPLSVPGPSE